MSIFKYFDLQVLEPQEDGSVSELDQHPADEIIDLSADPDGESLAQEWQAIMDDLHRGEDD